MPGEVALLRHRDLSDSVVTSPISTVQPIAPSSATDADLAEVAREIGFGQCARALQGVLATTPVGWLLVAWFAWARAPHANVVAWLGGFLCAWIVALVLLHSIVRQGPRQARHARRLLAVAIIDGVSWGAMCWTIVGLQPHAGSVARRRAVRRGGRQRAGLHHVLPRVCDVDGGDLGHPRTGGAAAPGSSGGHGDRAWA